ncbi:acetate--CoA ligase family protein, partial [Nonomuraea lactucae]|uniref:acetate--CoA ligase family protein n=1 Tax=Nonomuraea lactucae TaxID=2249762 RepID=UPI0013B39DCF
MAALPVPPELAPARPDVMEALFRPRSVAVIGASARPGFSAITLRNLVESGFPGAVYPVNRNHAELAGLTCYPSLESLPGSVDLALVVVPAARVVTVLEECAEAGVRSAIVYSSGFAELGEQGRQAQDRIVTIARQSGMRVLGPNCMGLFYQPSGLVASFTGSLQGGLLPSSGVAYVGRSGAIGGALLGMAHERGVGLAAWCSTGNEADLSTAELALALVEQDDVRVLAAYLETVPDGDAWTRLSARVRELDKHLVVLRSGRSEAGRKAAASHTGAMVRPDAAFTLVSGDHGVIGVDDIGEMVEVIDMVLAGRRPAGPDVAVITSSGGAGSILADLLEGAGLRLAELRPDTRTALAALIPEYGSAANPVDVTAQLFTQGGGAFEAACLPLLSDTGVGALTVVLTTVTGELAVTVAEGIVRVSRQTTKPIAVIWIAALAETWEARRILRHAGIPVTSSMPEHVGLLRNLLTGARTPARGIRAVAGAAADPPA